MPGPSGQDNHNVPVYYIFPTELMLRGGGYVDWTDTSNSVSDSRRKFFYTNDGTELRSKRGEVWGLFPCGEERIFSVYVGREGGGWGEIEVRRRKALAKG